MHLRTPLTKRTDAAHLTTMGKVTERLGFPWERWLKWIAVGLPSLVLLSWLVDAAVTGSALPLLVGGGIVVIAALIGIARDRLAPWPWWAGFVARIAGPVAALGLVLLVHAALHAHSRGGLGAGGFLLGAFAAAIGYSSFRKLRPSLSRVLGRASLGACGALFLFFATLFWQGHGADYQQTVAMRSTLLHVVQYQDRARDRTGGYVAELPDDFDGLHSNVLVPVRLTGDGWAATAKHARSERICAVFVGSTPAPPARVERQPRCSRGRLDRDATVLALSLLAGGLLVGGLVTARAGHGATAQRGEP